MARRDHERDDHERDDHERDDHERGDDGGSTGPELSPFVLATAGALFVSGVVGFLCGPFGPEDFGNMKRAFEETGLPLPTAVELGISIRPDRLSLALGLVGALAVVGAAQVKKPVLTWVLAGVLGFFQVQLLALDGLAMLGVFALCDRVGPDATTPPIPEPGATRDIAEEVFGALRAAVARGPRMVTLPDGTQRRYLVLGGAAGLPPAPSRADYATARAHPGCVILPWGSPDNTSSEAEAIVLWPHGVAGGPSPAALVEAARARADPGWLLGDPGGSAWGETSEGAPAVRLPDVVDLPDRPGYAVSLRLRRALDLAGEGSGVDHRHAPTWLDRDDPFSDELLWAELFVLRGFDRSARSPDPVPACNEPYATFRLLLAVPR